MIYKLTVYGFDSGLNELLAGRMYDFRTKKYRNPVKNKNDLICQKAINEHMKGVKIDKPIVIGYKFFCKDKRHDRIRNAQTPEGIRRLLCRLCLRIKAEYRKKKPHAQRSKAVDELFNKG